MQHILTPIVGARHAKRLARSYRNLRELAADRTSRWTLHGLPFRTAERLAVVLDVAAEYERVRWEPGQPFRGSADVFAHFRPLGELAHEEFHVVLLDQKHRLLETICVSTGSLTSSIVHPRDVLRPVILRSAAAIILCHNHPSGDATPSREDLEITRRLREVGELVGIRVLDHIVIGKGRWVSFVDDGFW